MFVGKIFLFSFTNNVFLVGGLCTYDGSSGGSCPGGGCKFTGVSGTLSDGYCTGGACTLDGESHPSSFADVLSS